MVSLACGRPRARIAAIKKYCLKRKQTHVKKDKYEKGLYWYYVDEQMIGEFEKKEHDEEIEQSTSVQQGKVRRLKADAMDFVPPGMGGPDDNEGSDAEADSDVEQTKREDSPSVEERLSQSSKTLWCKKGSFLINCFLLVKVSSVCRILILHLQFWMNCSRSKTSCRTWRPNCGSSTPQTL